MKKNEFEKQLSNLVSLVQGLEFEDGVSTSSALFGFIFSARTCLANALIHVSDFNES